MDTMDDVVSKFKATYIALTVEMCTWDLRTCLLLIANHQMDLAMVSTRKSTVSMWNLIGSDPFKQRQWQEFVGSRKLVIKRLSEELTN